MHLGAEIAELKSDASPAPRHAPATPTPRRPAAGNPPETTLGLTHARDLRTQCDYDLRADPQTKNRHLKTPTAGNA